MSSVPSLLIPENEIQRLNSIRNYNVKRALQEPVFGEFVTLAARIFDLPISLIALVDETDVLYQANHGLPDVHVQPRQEALCATAILDHKAVIYSDLSIESSPLITQQAAEAAHAKGLRFYAAAPIQMPDQGRIGAICIIDLQPRTFSVGEQGLLEQIASLISQMVAVRFCCLSSPVLGEEYWKITREQVQEELQGILALVRYIVYRHGTQVPVPEDILVLISRRLDDVREVLDDYES
jgi:hypothetical protein